MDGILIFVSGCSLIVFIYLSLNSLVKMKAGLFSASVTTFLVQSYNNLTSDSGDAAVALLAQILQQLNASQASIISSQTSVSFQPTSPTLCVNILWSLSLGFSITCALTATMVQQWSRNYVQAIERHAAPHNRARIRSYYHDGVQRFSMTTFVGAVPILLHLSVFLFFAGLLEFLSPINKTVAHAVLAVILINTVLYATITILPIIYHDCPYQSPLSRHFWLIWRVVAINYRLIQRMGMTFHWFRNPLYSRTIRQSMPEFGARIALTSSDRDMEALQWTVESLTEDDELELFLQGIPGFYASTKESTALPKLLDDGLGFRVKDLLMTCGGPLMDSIRQTRAVTCLDAIRVLTMALRGMPPRTNITTWTSYFDLFGTGDEIGRMVSSCRNDDSPTIAIHAICVITVVAGTLLNDSLLLSSRKNPALLELLSSFGPLDMCGLSADATRSFEKGHLAVLINFIHALVSCPSLHEEGLAVTISTLDFIMAHSSVQVGNACAELQEAFVQALIMAIDPCILLSNSSSPDHMSQPTQTILPYPVICSLMRVAAGLHQPKAKADAKLIIGNYLRKHQDDQVAMNTLLCLNTVVSERVVSIASPEASSVTHPPAARLYF